MTEAIVIPFGDGPRRFARAVISFNLPGTIGAGLPVAGNGEYAGRTVDQKIGR
ncbi:MAG: hypothetical protein VB858_01265 [Planctomycetaceae bacterium]